MKRLFFIMALFVSACAGDTEGDEPRELIEGDEFVFQADTPQEVEDQLSPFEINVDDLIIETEVFCHEMQAIKLALETYHFGTAKRFIYICRLPDDPDAGDAGARYTERPPKE